MSETIQCPTCGSENVSYRYQHDERTTEAVNEITDGLWLSDIETVAESDTSRFDYVISVCQDRVTENVSDNAIYDHINLADDEQSAEEWGGSCDYRTFWFATWAVRDAMACEGDVLVHCHKGRNRSAAVCATALAVEEGWTFARGLSQVASARREANPNELMRSHGHKYVHKHGDIE